jgi:hypothetical protein
MAALDAQRFLENLDIPVPEDESVAIV